MSDNKTCSTKKNQIVKLGDILEVLTDYHSNGSYKTLKENVTLLEQPNFAIMIRTTNFEKNDFRKNLIYINQQAYNFLSKSKVLHQDILINKIANAGAVYFMPRLDKPVSLGMNLFLLRIKKNYNKYFIFCILKYNEKRLRLMAKGTTTKTITKDDIKMFQILLPPLETQQKIARTLSILDQKIENNNKINELLHKILELLYEQYFVRFDFLDENNKPYQTSGGKMKFSKELNRLIPNDFEVKTLGDNPLCNTIKTGVTPFKQKVYYETKHIQETLSLNQGLKVSYNKRPNRANMQPAIYSVWFAKMKDTKKHLFLNQHMQSWIKESILSTGFCGLQCQKYTFEYIASTIKYSPFETRKNNLATGATQKAINIEALDYIFILIPNKELLDNYSKITKPLYEKISNNIIETQTLTALRDFLLPLLLKQQVKPQ
ncbi:restriction endonuclease subunit S [Helicobacter pylori]|nr:restriction endonuclease subunit S [Helicobacter pylori]WQU46891.1 restriction endonuclease subunit S [Helicobacter pylori]